MTGRTRQRLLAVALALLLLVALLGLLEAALRLTGNGAPPLPSPFADDEALGAEGSGALPDRELFYRLRPESQFLGYYRINALGYRGPPVAAGRAPGALRIVCTGDSSTFGLGVPEERAWPFVLGRLLEFTLGDLRPVEVIDAGVPGYTSLQNRVQIERDLLPLRPDLLIWMPMGHNDDSRVAGRTDSEALAFRRSLGFTLARTALGSALGLRVDAATPADTGATTDAPSAGPGLRPRVPLPEFEANLRAVAESCRAAGVPLMLVVGPHDATALEHRPNEKAAEELVLRVAKELNLAFSDPRKDLAALLPRPLYGDTVHPNADGQAVIGWGAFSSLAVHRGWFPWMEAREDFAYTWVVSHSLGLGCLEPETVLAADTPPRFRELLAACAGPAAALPAHDPIGGALRGPYGLGVELLAGVAAGPFARTERREELRQNVAPMDDFALLLLSAPFSEGDPRLPPEETPPTEQLAASRAFAALDAELGAHPAPADRRLFEAQRLADSGDGPGAQALLDQVLALNPRCAEAFAVRGQVLERGGDKAGALAAYEQGAQLEPDSATGLFLLGRSKLQRGDLPAAELNLRRALEQDPAHKLARLALVHTLIRAGRADDAQAQLRALQRVGATAVADVPALQAAIDTLRAKGSP